MARYKCPDWPESDSVEKSERSEPGIVGCGQEFEQEPDREGFVDCPHCGIWFNPKKEPETIVKK